MQSETIQLGQTVRYTLNCGKTWRVGKLAGYSDKQVQITTKKQVSVPTFYRFMGVIKVKTGTQLVWKEVTETLPAIEACNQVITLAQYAELRKAEQFQLQLYKVALKYAS